jgi:hypothetical protein
MLYVNNAFIIHITCKYIHAWTSRCVNISKDETPPYFSGATSYHRIHYLSLIIVIAAVIVIIVIHSKI